MTRLLARVARRSLPAALLAATLVAAVGLYNVLFSTPASPPQGSPLALNLSSAPALPAPDDSAALAPQQLPGAVPYRACPEDPPSCPRSARPEAVQPGCCR